MAALIEVTSHNSSKRWLFYWSISIFNTNSDPQLKESVSLLILELLLIVSNCHLEQFEQSKQVSSWLWCDCVVYIIIITLIVADFPDYAASYYAPDLYMLALILCFTLFIAYHASVCWRNWHKPIALPAKGTGTKENKCSTMILAMRLLWLAKRHVSGWSDAE